jgi:anthranilate phosphoribosyltransferase
LEPKVIREATRQVTGGDSLDQEQMTQVVDDIMEGKCKAAEISALLVALHEKGESVEELAGAALAMRKHMTPIRTKRESLVDTCGTGGGMSGIFNVSTAAAIVAASAGASVAKHGNKKSTSKTGSADVLKELGVNIECSVDTVEKCLDQLGLCFCFAPLFHPSVKHVTNVRKKLKHPTIFNLLGPLCNPAGAQYQVLGAGRGETRENLAKALALLGTERSIVVHSRDGLGEISTGGITDVSEIIGKQVRTAELTPKDFGIEESNVVMLKVNNPTESADAIRRIFDGHAGPRRDIVVMNAAAALWVAGICDGLSIAVERCQTAIDNGQAKQMLADLADLTNRG